MALGLAPREPAQGTGRDHGSAGLYPAITDSTAAVSPTSAAKTLTQSNERQAGTTPAVETRPRVGLQPTIPFIAAGTRPDPAVSVPSAKGTSPAATATADPELDPPEMSRPPKTLSQAPNGERTPVSPVANWSRFVFPTRIAPASSRRRTDSALRPGQYAKAGQAAVVGRSAASMLSLIANGMPNIGRPDRSPARLRRRRASSSARRRSRSAGIREIQMGFSPRPRLSRRSMTSRGSARPSAYAIRRARTPGVRTGICDSVSILSIVDGTVTGVSVFCYGNVSGFLGRGAAGQGPRAQDMFAAQGKKSRLPCSVSSASTASGWPAATASKSRRWRRTPSPGLRCSASRRRFAAM